MFYSIEVSGVNTSFINDIICGEYRKEFSQSGADALVIVKAADRQTK